jgi:hypothetical protein
MPEPYPGPAGPPVPQPEAKRGVLRARQILLSLVPFCSAGLLTFVPFLYIALVRRRRQDWITFVSYFAAVVALMFLISLTTAKGAAGDIVAVLLFALIGAGTTHSLVALRPGGAVAAAGRTYLPPPGFAPPDQDSVLRAARARIDRRRQARKLADDNPILGRDLKIGRPDLPRSYDDGGLVDVNRVPAPVLVGCLGLSPAEADASSRRVVSSASSPAAPRSRPTRTCGPTGWTMSPTW